MVQNAANGAVGQLVVKAAQARGIRTCNVVRSERGRDQLASVVGESDVVVVWGGGAEDGDLKTLDEATGGAHRLGSMPFRLSSGSPLLRRLGGHLTCYGLLSGQLLTLPGEGCVRRRHGRGLRFRVLQKIGMPDARRRLRALADKIVSQEIAVEVAQVYDFGDVEDSTRPWNTRSV